MDKRGLLLADVSAFEICIPKVLGLMKRGSIPSATKGAGPEVACGEAANLGAQHSALSPLQQRSAWTWDCEAQEWEIAVMELGMPGEHSTPSHWLPQGSGPTQLVGASSPL